MNSEEKNLKHFVEQGFSVFEAAPFKPFKHIMTFFRQMFFNFFSPFIKEHCLPIHNFFPQKYARNKKERNFRPQGLQIASFQQSFSQCWWIRPILKGSLIQKPT